MMLGFVILQAGLTAVLPLPQNNIIPSTSQSPNVDSTIPKPQYGLLKEKPEIVSISPPVQSATANSSIVKSEFRDDGVGNFFWAFETSDGIKAEQRGVPGMSRSGKAENLKNDTNNGSEGKQGAEVSGSYSYTAPNGQKISVTYTAGVDGFRPIGAHIPTLPPNFGSNKAPRTKIVGSSGTNNLTDGNAGNGGRDLGTTPLENTTQTFSNHTQ